MSEDETKDDVKASELWHLSAIVAGYNELAKVVTTLDQKAYCRFSRDTFEAELIAQGGARVTQPESGPPILEITAPAPGIRFYERDIEQMRAVVARHDAAKGAGVMGWASGSEIADNIWHIVEGDLPPNRRKAIARKIVEAFESEDCDTMLETDVGHVAGIVTDDERGSHWEWEE